MNRPKASGTRRATHAGSWYESNAAKLRAQLDRWLQEAAPAEFYPAKAIISPHAGFAYSGSCAAHAFNELDPQQVSRLFILGPSHHVSVNGIALSSAAHYDTPLGALTVDTELYAELYRDTQGLFVEMSMEVDEEEHSLEMQLPYVYMVMESRNAPYTIVPMMVGNLNEDISRRCSELLAGYMRQPGNAFVISSDFCHWGQRFSYQFYDNTWGPIHQSIKRLDRLAMASIKKVEHAAFESYLKTYKNTICGRNPIKLMIRTAQLLNQDPQAPKYKLKFLNYKQSSACLHMSDSSVSYVAASLKQFPAGEPLTPVPDQLADLEDL